MLFSRDFIPTVLAMAMSVMRAEAAIAFGTAYGFNGTFLSFIQFHRQDIYFQLAFKN